MPHPDADPDDWKAPREDDALLVWPESAAAAALENQRLLRRIADRRLGGVPLEKLRQLIRQPLRLPDPQTPLILAGHQTELHHPGVWVKDVLTDALARQLGGSAIHLAVDTDQPKHLRLSWPGRAFDLVGPSAAWSGLLPPIDPRMTETIARAAEQDFTRFGYRPMLGSWLEFARAHTDQPLARLLGQAGVAVDRSMGLTRELIFGTDLWSTPAFACCTLHLLDNAHAFATDYNAALRDHRKDHSIRDVNRPMPDLRLETCRIELPLWLDDLQTSTRRRASVEPTPSGPRLVLEGRPAIEPPHLRDPIDRAIGWFEVLRDHQVRLSPRALTLTMFVRLCVCDLFVHGIGGARYDDVTDRILTRHFGIQPPRFAVATATMRFPTARDTRPLDLSAVLHAQHRARHAVPAAIRDPLLHAIASAGRKSVERARLFQELHRARHAMIDREDLLRRQRAELQDARHRLEAEREIFSRELFYLLQPRQRLEAMVEKVRRRVIRPAE